MNNFNRMENNNSSLNGLYNKRNKGLDKFYLLSEHSHIWADKNPVYKKCPTNMCLVFMTPIGYSTVEYIPKRLKKKLYSSMLGLQQFRDNPTQFLLKNKNVINYCNIILPDHYFLDCSITLKPYTHEHKNQLGLYSLPLEKNNIDMLQNKFLPKYLKVNGTDDYGKDVDLSKLLSNKLLFPKDKSIDLNFIFVDTCRVLWARLPGISYQNEYISFRKAVHHNKKPTVVEKEKGRFFTLKNDLRENQNQNKFVLRILNEVSKYKNFEIYRTKKFLKTFTLEKHNIKTQQLLNRYSITTQNSNLKALTNHVKSFNKNINDFFKLKNANNLNMKYLNNFYVQKNIQKNINSTLETLVDGISCEF